MIAKKLDQIVEFVVAFVGNSYESYPLIVDETMSWAKAEGNDCSEAEIAEAIRTAVKKGLVSSYRTGSRSGQLEPWNLGAEELKDLWFHASPEARKGMGLPPRQ